LYCVHRVSDMPLALTARRVLCSVVGCVKSSARKRCIQSSQLTGIPRYPSQTPTNVAAYEIAFGPKLCNSTP
jgi:hypothetical protein